MRFQIKKATKEQAKARISLVGPSGSGKTWTALTLAGGLGNSVVVIDTENASASKYADSFEFDVLVLEDFAPQTYVEAIHHCESQGYNVIVIDSLSHAWTGKGGVLEQKDRAAKKTGYNDFTAWREVTPHHNALVDALVKCKTHLIATMRAKTEYIMESGKDGKMVPRKIGLAPVQRDGLEYEFDIVADMNLDHDLIISKTRCQAVDGLVINKPTVDIAYTIKEWLTDGAAVAPVRQAGPQLSELESLQEKLIGHYGRVYGIRDREKAWNKIAANFLNSRGKHIDAATVEDLSQIEEHLAKLPDYGTTPAYKTEVIA